MNLAAHLYRPSSPTPPRDREVAVLRLVGRLGMTQGIMIRGLVLPDMPESSARKLLRTLVERKLLWHANRPNHDAAGRLRGRTPRVYGLTEEGRQLLDTLGAEPHRNTLRQLVIRSKHAATPSSAQLVEETYVSDWCATLLDQVRRHPMFAGVRIQRHYQFTDDKGALLQTMGTLVVLTFNEQQTNALFPAWTLPWLAGDKPSHLWKTVCFSLEVCPSPVDQRALLQMAQTYRDLADSGLYRSLADVNLRPVIITETAHEAEVAGTLWQERWKGSSGIISSKERTCHPEYGVLWGSYTSLGTLGQEKQLLGPLLGTVDRWPAKIKGWPGFAAPATTS